MVEWYKWWSIIASQLASYMVYFQHLVLDIKISNSSRVESLLSVASIDPQLLMLICTLQVVPLSITIHQLHLMVNICHRYHPWVSKYFISVVATVSNILGYPIDILQAVVNILYVILQAVTGYAQQLAMAKVHRGVILKQIVNQ